VADVSPHITAVFRNSTASIPSAVENRKKAIKTSDIFVLIGGGRTASL
jgi:hypothetical protein